MTSATLATKFMMSLLLLALFMGNMIHANRKGKGKGKIKTYGYKGNYDDQKYGKNKAQEQYQQQDDEWNEFYDFEEEEVDNNAIYADEEEYYDIDSYGENKEVMQDKKMEDRWAVMKALMAHNSNTAKLSKNIMKNRLLASYYDKKYEEMKKKYEELREEAHSDYRKWVMFKRWDDSFGWAGDDPENVEHRQLQYLFNESAKSAREFAIFVGEFQRTFPNDSLWKDKENSRVEFYGELD